MIQWESDFYDCNNRWALSISWGYSNPLRNSVGLPIPHARRPRVSFKKKARARLLLKKWLVRKLNTPRTRSL